MPGPGHTSDLDTHIIIYWSTVNNCAFHREIRDLVREQIREVENKISPGRGDILKAKKLEREFRENWVHPVLTKEEREAGKIRKRNQNESSQHL
jgi:hypothetical protein